MSIQDNNDAQTSTTSKYNALTHRGWKTAVKDKDPKWSNATTEDTATETKTTGAATNATIREHATDKNKTASDHATAQKVHSLAQIATVAHTPRTDAGNTQPADIGRGEPARIAETAASPTEPRTGLGNKNDATTPTVQS